MIFVPMAIGAITAIGGAVFSVAAAIAGPIALMVGTFYAIGAVWPTIYSAVSTVATAIYRTVADNFNAIVDTAAEDFETAYSIVSTGQRFAGIRMTEEPRREQHYRFSNAERGLYAVW